MKKEGKAFLKKNGNARSSPALQPTQMKMVRGEDEEDHKKDGPPLKCLSLTTSTSINAQKGGWR